MRPFYVCEPQKESQGVRERWHLGLCQVQVPQVCIGCIPATTSSPGQLHAGGSPVGVCQSAEAAGMLRHQPTRTFAPTWGHGGSTDQAHVSMMQDLGAEPGCVQRSTLQCTQPSGWLHNTSHCTQGIFLESMLQRRTSDVRFPACQEYLKMLQDTMLVQRR